MTSHPLRRATSLGLAGLLAIQPLLAAPAFARPEGAEVVDGAVAIDQAGDTTVIHASDRSIIEYRSFDIGAHETVQFIQPSELARVLNRIDAAKPSQIDGSILANGQVYIVNPAGVIFGQDAVIDVARLVATAGSISNENFASGVDHFTDVMGPVQNQGQIDARIVELIGRQVANQGTIHAEQGWITMVAGDDVILGSPQGNMFVRIEGSSFAAPDQAGVVNEGSLAAEGGRVVLAAGDVYSLAIRQSGTTVADEITLDGGANGLVEVSGSLDASNAAGTGGRIDVLGDKVALLDATLDASGRDGGGSVHVGGDFQGKGELRTAARTYVSSDATIRADATEQGDGGTVIVWGDEVTGFYGEIDARGGAAGGDGGFAEVSGKDALLYRGSTDLSAAQGEVGTLLLDPTDVLIGGGTGDGAEDADALDSTFGDISGVAGAVTLFESEVQGQSGTADVVIQATNTVKIDLLAGSPDNILALGNDFAVSAGGAFSMDNGASIAAGTNDVAISGSSVQVGAIAANNVQLRATSGDVTQTAAITATGLGAQATTGSVLLDNAANAVDVFAAAAGGTGGAGMGDVAFQNATGFQVGEVAAVGGVGPVNGITAPGGDVQLRAVTGSITQTHGITTSGLGARADDGSVLLTAPVLLGAHNNNVDTFAAFAGGAGDVAFQEATGFQVDTVAAVGSLGPLSGITALGGDVQLRAVTGHIAQQSIAPENNIEAAGLGARADEASVQLDNAANAVDVFAALAGGTGGAGGGDVAFQNATGFQVGEVAAVGGVGPVNGITVPGGVAQLQATSGDITQTQAITGAGLGARAVAGSVLLGSVANDVGTFEASASGNVAFQDLDEFAVGDVLTVNGLGAFSGVAATGTGAIELRAGGAITADAGAEIDLDDNAVTLIGATVGSTANPINVTGNDDGGSSLVVTSSGGVEIDVVTDEFDSVALTLASAAANANIDLAGTDGIDVEGEGTGTAGASTITADTRANGADVAFKLTEADKNILVGGTGIRVASDVQLEAAGDVTQAAAIVANGLGAKAGGDVLLTNAGNTVDTFAAEAGSDVAFREGSADGFEVGTVAAVGGIGPRSGITATDDVQLQATTGATTQTAAITADGLELLGAGPYTLTNAGNDVNMLAASTTEAVSYRDADDLTVAVVGGTTGITTTDDDVSLQTGTALAVNGAVGLGAGELELIAGGATTQTAAITADGLELLGAGPYTLTNAGNDVNMLAASTTEAVSYRDADDLTVAAVGGTTGITTMDDDVSLQTGTTLAVNGAVGLGAGELELIAGGATTQTAAITADGLELLGAGPYTLTNAGNDVNTLAASTTEAVSYLDADDLTVAAVGGTTGITTTDDDVSLQTGTTLAVNGAVSVGTANVQLQADTGDLTQTARITAAGLGARADAGNVTLLHADNAVTTLAADASGTVAYHDTDTLAVGTVAGVDGLAALTGVDGAAVALDADEALAIGALVNATGNVQLRAVTGDLTQTAAITAAGLGAKATVGSVLLASVANDVDTFEASASGDVAFRDADAFVVGNVATVNGLGTFSGIAATAAQLQADTGDLTQTHAITATGLGAKATVGSVLLASVANDVDTFEASASGDVAFRDADAFVVGNVATVNGLGTFSGIAATAAQLQADTGDLTQTARITAAGLGARADAGNVTLLHADNAVTTLAADASGTVAYHDTDTLAVGTVGAVDGLAALTGVDGAAVALDADEALAIGALVNATGNVQLRAATGDVTQTARITAAGLGARADAGNVTLLHADNAVTTLAADASGTVAYHDTDTLAVGTVAGVDGLAAFTGVDGAAVALDADEALAIGALVNATGNVQLRAVTGDLTQTARITAAGLGARADAGNVTLLHADNAVTTLAADASGTVAYHDTDTLAVGTVAGVDGLADLTGVDGAAVALSSQGALAVNAAVSTENATPLASSGFTPSTHAGGDVELFAATGDITQAAPITANGLGARADDGSVLLTEPSNSIDTFAALAAGTAHDVAFQEVDGFEVGTVGSVSGITALGDVVQLQTTSGDITQTDAITATGLGAKATAGSVLLGSVANDVDTFEASASGDVAFRDADAFVVGDVAAVNGLGTFSGIAATAAQLQADTGDITQTDAITATGLGAKATAGSVLLGSVANDVDTFEASASGDVAFRDADAFVVGNVATVNGLGTFSGIAATAAQLQADTGDITQTAAITAAGLGAKATAGSVLLGSVANDVDTFEASASGDVAFRDADAFVVGDVAAVNGLGTFSGIAATAAQLQADTGDITQTDAITATGLGAKATAGSVLLGSVANDVDTFEASASGDVAFRDADAFVVGNVAAVNGLGGAPQSGITATTVQLQADTGDITQTDAITATGLGAKATVGSVLLGSVANDVDAFEASASGDVAFRDADAFVVGDVAAVNGLGTFSGIAATAAQLQADTGDLTQTDAITATGLGAKATVGSVLLASVANDVDTFEASASGDVAFRDADAFVVGNVATVNGLGTFSGIAATAAQLQADTGDLTQTHAITATGLGAKATVGSVLLASVANDVDTFEASASGDVAFRDADAFVVGNVATVNGLGTFSGIAATAAQLQADTGDLTQTHAITATGLGARADAGNVTLLHADNAVTTLAADASGTVAYHDTDTLAVGTVGAVDGLAALTGVDGAAVALDADEALAIGALVNATGNVQLRAATGDVTQTARITAAGLGARADAGNVTLLHADNAVTTLAADASGTVAYHDTDTLAVGTVGAVDGLAALTGVDGAAVALDADEALAIGALVNATGNVQLRAVTGDLTQTAAITAAGLGARADAGNVTLLHADNAVTTLAADASGTVAYHDTDTLAVGTVAGVDGLAALTGVDGAAVALDADEALAIGALVNATGNVQLRAATGDLTQTAAITAAGLGARADAGNVTLLHADNAVATLAADASGTVAYHDTDTLAVGTVAGVDGLAALTGVDGAAVALDADEALAIGALVNATGNAQLRAATGDLTQTARITAAGLGARADAGNVTLLHADNAVTTLAADASGTVAYHDTDTLAVGTVAGVDGIAALTGVDGAAVALDADEALAIGALVNATGNVQLRAVTGDLTQTAAITAAGLGARADAGNVTLLHADNAVATLAADASGTVAYHDTDTLAVGTVAGVDGLAALTGVDGAAVALDADEALAIGALVNATGNAQLRAATGDLTQTAAITAAGLGARADAGNVTLLHADNAVTTLAADASGTVAYHDTDTLAVGTVGAVDGLAALTGVDGAAVALDADEALAIGALVNATGNVQLRAVTGDLTQTAAITAAGLGARADAGNVTLLHADNAVTTLAADASGTVAYHDTDTLAVGTVGAVDGLAALTGVDGAAVALDADEALAIGALVNATGNVQLRAATGDLTQTAAITAAGLGARADAGNVTLLHADNAVTTLAADASGTVAYHDTDTLAVGTVGAVDGLAALTGVDGAAVALDADEALAIGALVNATGNAQLRAATGDLTQTAEGVITAARLGAQADNGSVLLDNPANDVDTFGGSADDDVIYRDANDLVVGTVAAVGGIPALTGVTATNGSIEIDAPGLLVFDTDVTTVDAGGDILLNTKLGDPTEIPPTATIVGRATSLTLTAGGDIEIGIENALLGSGQKFTVLGDFALNAGGTVQTGDLSALTLKIDANTIHIVRRQNGPVLLADGTLVGDGGVDFVADTIELTATTIEDVGTEGKMFFSTQNGDIVSGVPRPNVDSFFNRVFDPPRALTTADLESGTDVLDLVGAGSIQTRLSTQPILIEEVTLGPEFFAKLIDQAKGGKPLWASEIVEYLECSLFEGEDAADVPLECREYLAQAPDTRLDTEGAKRAKENLQAIYDESDAIYAALQKAASGYLAKTPPGAASGAGFRSFVERSPEHAQARSYLQRIGELFEAVNEISPEQADAAELEQWRILLLQDVTPSGLSAEELEDAIGAGRGPTAPTARRLLLISGDGIPVSMR